LKRNRWREDGDLVEEWWMEKLMKKGARRELD
jgi:hypothetical protein